MKRAIVLSGGGAKGAYQIGVWKALRKLNIKYSIVTGTSVGALNGALMVQKDYLKAIWMWFNINFGLIFSDNFSIDYKSHQGKKEIFKKYAKNILLNGGMDVSKLEDTINRAINKRKFYNSNIDYGLITVKLPKFEPITLTKKEIPRDKLNDYLIASAACYPAFKKKDIDGVEFIDGGFYDNLPINMAIEMGAEDIIAVDLNAVGVKKRVKDKKVNITYIKPRNDIGNFLIFHKDLSRKAMKLGFNDTMKTFNKLDGNLYTFKLGDLNNNINHYEKDIKELLVNLFKVNKKSNLLSEILKVATYSKIINGSSKKEINKIIEYLGKVFKMDETVIYDIKKYNKELLVKLNDIGEINIKSIEQNIKSGELKEIFNTLPIIKYIYDKIVTNNKDIGKIALLFPKEFMAAVYLVVIGK